MVRQRGRPIGAQIAVAGGEPNNWPASWHTRREISSGTECFERKIVLAELEATNRASNPSQLWDRSN